MDIIRLMKGPNRSPQSQKLAQQLENALKDGKVRYLLADTPINQLNNKPKIKKTILSEFAL